MPVWNRGFAESPTSKKCIGVNTVTPQKSRQEETEKMDYQKKVKFRETTDCKKVPQVMKDSKRMAKCTPPPQCNESRAMINEQGNTDEMSMSSTRTDTLRAFRFCRDYNIGNDTVEKYKNVTSKQLTRKTRNGDNSNKEIFSCYECKEEFAVKSLLIQHLQVHFGANIFQGGAQHVIFGEQDECEVEYTNPCSSEDGVSVPNGTEKAQETLIHMKGEKRYGSSRMCSGSETYVHTNNGLIDAIHEEPNDSELQENIQLLLSELQENIQLLLDECHVKQNIKATDALNGDQSGKNCIEPQNVKKISKRCVDEDIQMKFVNSCTCKICKKKFPDLQNLRSHISVVHLFKKYNLNECCLRHSFEKLDHKKSIHENEVANSWDSSPLSDTCKETKNVEHFETTSSTNEDCSPGMPSDTITRVPDTDQSLSNGTLLSGPNEVSLKQGMDSNKAHSCSVCLKRFSRKSYLKAHMRSHSGEKIHSCSVCSKGFPWRSILKAHMLIHSGEKNHSCSVCSQRFTTKRDLQRHMLTHSGERNFSCTVCSKRFTLKSNLEVHILTHSGERNHSCSVCSKRFTRKDVLKLHMLSHTGQRQHSCHVCLKKFARKGDLETHMLTHSGEKPHSCSVCSKRFSQKSSLNVHMLIHSGRKQHSCSICSKRFTLKGNLKAHMLTHSGEKRHSCSVCSKGFPWRSTLEAHMLIHSGENVEHFEAISSNKDCSPGMPSDTITTVPDTDQSLSNSTLLSGANEVSLKQGMDSNKAHSCSVSLKTFTTKGSLITHMQSHSGEKRDSCSVCSKGFPWKSTLEAHMLIHSGENVEHFEAISSNKDCSPGMPSDTITTVPDTDQSLSNSTLLSGPNEVSLKQGMDSNKAHSCSVCLKRFTTKGSLKAHMLTHSGEKRHSCSVCSKGFPWRSTLEAHMLIHSGEKNHSCSVCSRRFTMKRHLQRHMLTHSGERNFSCTVCSKRFALKSNLEVHILTHSGERNHSCSVCSKRFTRKDVLKLHMLSHTGQRQHSCHVCLKKFVKKGDLEIHMLTHSGEKPHSCSVCSKRFSQKSSLNVHMLIHSGQKQHSCSICSKRCKLKGNLKAHILTHSGEKPLLKCVTNTHEGK